MKILSVEIRFSGYRHLLRTLTIARPLDRLMMSGSIVFGRVLRNCSDDGS